MDQMNAFELYTEGNYSESLAIFQNHLESLAENDPRDEYLMNLACCLASSGNIQTANDILVKLDFNSFKLLYNKALCRYLLADYRGAIELANQILRKIAEEYPQLYNNPVEVVLDESARKDIEECTIIETINLKASSIFKIKGDLLIAREILSHINFKEESEIDCVTLHNSSIFEFPIVQGSSVDKLAHLCELYNRKKNLLVPIESFYNLLLMYLLSDQQKFVNFKKQNITVLEESQPKDLLNYLELIHKVKSSDHELSQRSFDETLIQIEKSITSSNSTTGAKSIRQLKNLAMVVVTHQLSFLWMRNQYSAVRNAVEKWRHLLDDKTDLMRRVVAHSIFIQDTRYEESSGLYEDLIASSPSDSLLYVDPYVLGNLCVSYVLTGRNSEAENLIKDVETDENLASTNGFNSDTDSDWWTQNQSRSSSHLRIINVIIGTLYCVKNNYPFGLARIFKSTDPSTDKMDLRLWNMTKRCIMSLIDRHCKQIMYVDDDTFDFIVKFLISCEKSSQPSNDLDNTESAKKSVELAIISREAAYLRSTLLPIIHD